MSLSPNEKYPGRVDIDPNYQDGKFKDSDPSTANNGSPLKAIDRNEQLALQEAVMDAAGFEYSGVADTPQNSQMFKAYKAALSNGANLLSNHNFLTSSPDDITHPNATPETYAAGTQIFSGVYAGDSGCTITLIDGRVNCTAGDYQFKVPNTGGLDRVPVFASSVADYDGKPKTTGVSHALDGDKYVITVEPAAGDVFSVKFEQGSVATGHEVDNAGGDFYTLEQLGANGVDDTVAIDLACKLNVPIKLVKENYYYKQDSHIGATSALPQVIIGEQSTINCVGQAQFGLRDNSTHMLKSFTSDDVFTIDPSVPRSSAQSGVMLITNIEDITNYKCHCDFEYSAGVDGSTRGEGFIRIASTVECDLDINSTQTGAVVSTWINPEAGEIHGTIKFKNCETGLLKRSGMSEDLKLELINTPSQILNWRNTTDTVPSKNGKDCILSEASSVKTPETNVFMRTYYAIERGAYIQRAGKGKFDGWSYGSDVGKCTDDSEGLEVYATAILTPDGSTEQRYSWQVYGGANGAVKDIDIHPICHNLTGVQGNKEAFSVLGECENITVHQPYGYECGNGLWLLQDAGGIFSPKIDGLTIIGGRAEGENGVTPPNGAISAWFSAVGAGQYLRNLVVDGTTSMPSSSGKDTFIFTNIEESVSVLNVKVDGVNDSQSYQNHVVITDCEGVTQSAQELYISNSGFLSPKPFAIQRTDLATNSTISKVIATFTDATVNPASVQVEIRARHNGQPNGNSIDYKALCYVGATSANFVVNDEVSILASGQSISLTYDEVAKTVTLNHTSSSPLGFDDSTFYSRVMASKEII